MSLWGDPGYYRDEAAQRRKRAATTSDSAELRDSYLALARSYERLDVKEVQLEPTPPR